jgi:hypothetical protein
VYLPLYAVLLGVILLNVVALKKQYDEAVLEFVKKLFLQKSGKLKSGTLVLGKKHSWGLYYETFYGRNLRMFVTS